jgi:hypothetical protein
MAHPTTRKDTIMAGFDGLIDLIPVGDIAKQFGIPESVAESAIEQIIPAVVGGMAANSQTSSGAKSLETALGQHQETLPSGTVKIESINTADGSKIVKNVFGEKAPQVAAAVADSNSSGDVTKDLIAKLLPIVAPIIIAYIANQFLGQKTAAPAPAEAPASADGGIGDLLGGLLGSKGGQDIIGGVLGGLLGGGRS